MKRAKKLASLITVAALTLGSVGTVFADTLDSEGYETNLEEDEAIVYDDLVVKNKNFYGNSNTYMGSFPVIAGMDELNKEIDDIVFKTHYNYASDFSHSSGQNTYELKYSVNEYNQYTEITLFVYYKQATDKDQPRVQIFEFFVDKSDFSEITKQEFVDATTLIFEEDEEEISDETVRTEAPETEEVKEEAATEIKEEAQTEDTEEVEAEEDSEEDSEDEEEDSEDEEEDSQEENKNLVELEKTLKDLDVAFECKEDPSNEGVYLIYRGGDYLTVITVGENEYAIEDEKIELESAPVEKDGVIYVPAEFFSRILGGKVTGNADKGFKFSIPAATDKE